MAQQTVDHLDLIMSTLDECKYFYPAANFSVYDIDIGYWCIIFVNTI